MSSFLRCRHLPPNRFARRNRLWISAVAESADIQRPTAWLSPAKTTVEGGGRWFSKLELEELRKRGGEGGNLVQLLCYGWVASLFQATNTRGYLVSLVERVALKKVSDLSKIRWSRVRISTGRWRAYLDAKVHVPLIEYLWHISPICHLLLSNHLLAALYISPPWISNNNDDTEEN